MNNKEKFEDNKEDDSIIEFIKAIIFAALIALTIRSFYIEPFNIPSGSMFPTLHVGDYLFVKKYEYGYSTYSFPMDMISFDGRIFKKPAKTGDIAVFRHPRKPGINYIKRIIGTPGDTVQMKKGILYINGVSVPKDFRNNILVDKNGDIKTEQNKTIYKEYIETLPNGVKHSIYELSDNAPLDNTEEFTIPEDYYFAMGDNRDNSQDSRAINEVGFIPAENLVGKAWFIFYSTEGTEKQCIKTGRYSFVRNIACRIMEWPGALRLNRFFTKVHNMKE